MIFNDVIVASMHHNSHPTSPDILVVYSLVLFLMGDLDSAKTKNTEALKLDPDNSTAKKLRSRIKLVIASRRDGFSAYNKKNWEEALKKFSDALEVSNYVL